MRSNCAFFGTDRTRSSAGIYEPTPVVFSIRRRRRQRGKDHRPEEAGERLPYIKSLRSRHLTPTFRPLEFWRRGLDDCSHHDQGRTRLNRQLHRCCLSASASRLDLQTPPSAQRARTGNPGAPLRTRRSHPHRAQRVASKKNWRPMRPGETFRLQQHHKPQRGYTLGGELFLPAHSDHHLHLHHHPEAEDGANISIFINY